jgi:hypothetical protein
VLLAGVTHNVSYMSCIYGQEMKRSSLLFASLVLLALAPSQLPQPGPGASSPAAPSSWTAKDSHEGFTVAADAYSDPARTKEKFAKADPYKAGLLAVDVFLKNDTAYPVHVDLSTIRLDVDSPDGQRSHLPALNLEAAAKQIAHPEGPSLSVPHRLPPILSTGEDGKTRDAEKKLDPLALQSDVVPPNGTLRGFLFFDVSGHFDLVPYASLYVPDVKSVAADNPMIYFDVPLHPKRPQ